MYARAQLTDVDNIAVAGSRHLLHQCGAEDLLGLPDLPRVLLQQLKNIVQFISRSQDKRFAFLKHDHCPLS